MRNKIISEIAKSQRFADLITKVTSNHELSDDLKQEVLIALCNYDENLLIQAYNKGEVYYLVARIALNMFHSSTSEFYRVHRKSFEVYYEEEKYNPRIDIIYYEVIKIIDNDTNILTLYERLMLMYYFKYGSMRELHKKSKIPLKTCFEVIKRAKGKLKKHIYDKYSISSI